MGLDHHCLYWIFRTVVCGAARAVEALTESPKGQGNQEKAGITFFCFECNLINVLQNGFNLLVHLSVTKRRGLCVRVCMCVCVCVCVCVMILAYLFIFLFFLDITIKDDGGSFARVSSLLCAEL